MARDTTSLGLTALATLAALAVAPSRPREPSTRNLATLLQPQTQRRIDSANRQINWAAALLALAALADSGVEHYRGSFHNKTMYVPLGAAALTFIASLRDAVFPSRSGRERDVVDTIAVATGLIGTGFHLYNVAKRPGGFSWLNLFYAAPLGAPAALSLAGLLRRVSALIGSRVVIAGVGARKLLIWLVSFGLLGSSAEAGLLHFRGAYHNPAMVIPITAPPVAAGLLLQAASKPGEPHPKARYALWLLAGVGLLGSAFHVYGIQRNTGGWRNWSQNVLNGPPLPAPPAFTALAIAGLAALSLIERREP
jgi:hypothetical protein